MTRDINTLALVIHHTAVKSGFWESERNFGEMIALAHSELSEALEEHRDGKPGFYLKNVETGHLLKDITPMEYRGLPDDEKAKWKPEGYLVELADCIIRLLDTMGSEMGSVANENLISDVMNAKMSFNDTRGYKHGKAY